MHEIVSFLLSLVPLLDRKSLCVREGVCVGEAFQYFLDNLNPLWNFLKFDSGKVMGYAKLVYSSELETCVSALRTRLPSRRRPGTY